MYKITSQLIDYTVYSNKAVRLNSMITDNFVGRMPDNIRVAHCSGVIMEMDTHLMAEVRSSLTHSSLARIAVETLTSTKRRYGCWRTRATRKVSKSEFLRWSCLKLFKSLARAIGIYELR